MSSEAIERAQDLPVEMVEAAAGVLMPYPNLERSHIDMARDALVAAGVPALLEERDRLRALGSSVVAASRCAVTPDRLTGAIHDLAAALRGGSE